MYKNIKLTGHIYGEVYFQQNIGSVFRICDAFGVESIIFTGEHFILSERKVNKTSRNTHKTVPFEIIRDKNIDNIINFGSKNFLKIKLQS